MEDVFAREKSIPTAMVKYFFSIIYKIGLDAKDIG